MEFHSGVNGSGNTKHNYGKNVVLGHVMYDLGKTKNDIDKYKNIIENYETAKKHFTVDYIFIREKFR